MIKQIKLVVLLLLPFFCYSQNLDNLDLKYGFNKFKLGTSFSSYKNDLKFFFTAPSSGTKYYRYLKKDIKIFGYDNVNEIKLGFYKDKLYVIDIVMNSQNNNEMYSSIYGKLKDLFGNPNITNPRKDYGENDFRTYMENGNQWLSDKTLLGLNFENCNSPIHPCTVNVFLISQIIQRQINNDLF